MLRYVHSRGAVFAYRQAGDEYVAQTLALRDNHRRIEARRRVRSQAAPVSEGGGFQAAWATGANVVIKVT